MKKVFLLLVLVVYSCAKNIRTIETYKLENYNGSEVPVCIEYQQEAEILKYGHWDLDNCGNHVYSHDLYKPITDNCHPIKTSVVSYGYCLERLPKPVHLVEKKKNDMTICYDRNNKIELPILYCQKDMINIQTTNVSTKVFQQTIIK